MKSKKVFSLFLCLFILISNPFFYYREVWAEGESSEIEIELQENVNKQLQNLDMGALDQYLEDIAGADGLFQSESFLSKVQNLISGNIIVNSSSIVSYIFNIFIGDVFSYLPVICLIIAIVVLCSMLTNVGGSNKKIGDIINFVCFGTVIIIIMAIFTGIIADVNKTLVGIKGQMEGVFPLLLTLLAALGGVTSVSVYQPAMAVLSGGVINVFTSILMPIFSFKLVFIILSNLSSSFKFKKFSEFFGSLYKWIIGIVVTIFTAFVSIQGLMAGSVDGVSIKTAKYTIKSGVPIVGGLLADGMGLVTISSSLIKNAIGTAGLILMFATIIAPIVKIIVFSLMLKLTSAILEPISNAAAGGLVGDLSKNVSLILAILLGTFFMFFILIGLIMCSANVI